MNNQILYYFKDELQKEALFGFRKRRRKKKRKKRDNVVARIIDREFGIGTMNNIADKLKRSSIKLTAKAINRFR